MSRSKAVRHRRARTSKSPGVKAKPPGPEQFSEGPIPEDTSGAFYPEDAPEPEEAPFVPVEIPEGQTVEEGVEQIIEAVRPPSEVLALPEDPMKDPVMDALKGVLGFEPKNAGELMSGLFSKIAEEEAKARRNDAEAIAFREEVKRTLGEIVKGLFAIDQNLRTHIFESRGQIAPPPLIKEGR